MNILRVRPWNWLTREASHGADASAHENSSIAKSYLSGNPWGLHREIDKLFESAFRHLAHQHDGDYADGVIMPKADISATEREYCISADLPGIEENDIEIEVKEDILNINAKREQEVTDEKKNYYKTERYYGAYQRLFHLPEDADSENITANYKNGVLTISVARKPVLKNEAKKISITS